MHEQQRDQSGSRCRSRAQNTKTLWPDVQNLGREDRQQRRCPAEQDREEIEQLCAKQLRLFEQKSNSYCEILSNRGAVRFDREALVGNPSEQHDGKSAQHSLDDVRQARTGKAVEHSTGCRAEDSSELPERGTPRDGIGVCLTRNNLGAKRGTCRLLITARKAADGDDAEDRKDCSVQQLPGIDRQNQQRHTAAKLNCERNQRQDFAIVSVGDVSGVQCCANEGKSLRETNQSE